jgi:zinc transport system ATP-binding protein
MAWRSSQVTPPTDNPVIALDNVTFSFNRKPVLENVTLQVNDRDFVWVVGPNGGGKTTLVRILMGLLRPRQGSVRIFGSDVLSARRRIGYMPQNPHLDRRFPVTVMDVTLTGRLSAGILPYRYTSADHQAAEQALEMVGLLTQAQLPLHELSGGQQRRLLIARALVSEPELLILDEPTANLDRNIEAGLFELLRELNKRLTIVMISHDPAFVSDFVEHVVCVNRTVGIHPTAALQPDFIAELYGSPVRLVRHDLHNHRDQDREKGA